MKPYLFKIGNFELRIYSLMYIISLFVSIFIIKHDKILRKRLPLTDKNLEDCAFLVMVTGLIGARIYYVIFSWHLYQKNLISIFYVWQGGLAIHGGIIGGIIGIYFYAKSKNINFFKISDLAVSPIILSQGLGRIGNLANGEIHGVPVFTPLKVIFTNKFPEWWQYYQNASHSIQAKFYDIVPWGIVFPKDTPAGMEFPNYSLHPAMVYEMILNFFAFIFLWFFMRKQNFKPGIISFTYLILYGIIRTFVSFFRAEDLMIYGIRAPHAISIVMIIVSIIGIILINKYGKE